MTASSFLLSSVLRDLEETTLYQRGALDVLRLLGLITLENGKGAPTGDVAQMVLTLLAEQADEGSAFGFDWNDLDADGLKGVDILRAIQAVRGESLATRSVCVAQAIIKGTRHGVDYYLMQYDHHAGQYQPIGGKVEDGDEDSAAALRREISEELELEKPLTSQQCSLTLLASDWTATKISPTYGVLTDYTFDFFHVTEIDFKIKQTAFTRWLRRGEIERGRADDSRSISTLYLEALGMDRLDALESEIRW